MQGKVFVEILPDSTGENFVLSEEANPVDPSQARVVLTYRDRTGRSQRTILEPLPGTLMEYDPNRGSATVRLDRGDLLTIVSVCASPQAGATLKVQRLLDGRYEVLDIPPDPQRSTSAYR